MLFFERLYFIILIWILPIVGLIAQKANYKRGYYLDTANSKVEGFFDFDKLEDNIVTFSSTKTGANTQRLLPVGISKIIVEDSITIYIQKIEQNNIAEYLYLEPLLTGNISFYRGCSKKREEIFFISAIDKPKIRRINRADSKAFFKAYFEGCEQVKKRLSTIYYDKISLINIIKQFEDCYTKNGVSYNVEIVKKLTNYYFEIGGQIGVSFARSNIFLKQQANYLSVPVGIQLRYNLRNNIFFALGFKFSQFNLTDFKSDSVVSRIPGNYSSYFFVYNSIPEIKNVVLEFPFEFGYKLKAIKTIVPFVSLGVTISKEVSNINTTFVPKYYYFKPNPGNESLPERLLKEGLPTNPTANSYNNTETSRYLSVSFLGGLGLRKAINSKWALESALRYFYKFSSIEQDPFNTTVNTQRLELTFNVLYHF